MKNLYAEIGDSEGNKDTVFDITPDLASAFIDAIRNSVGVNPPRQAQAFDDLTATIAQTSRLIQHLEAFRELAIAQADRTGPHVDRKALAIAAAMPPSRLYRVLEKHGRPRNRAQAYDKAVHQAMDEGVRGIPEIFARTDQITEK